MNPRKSREESGQPLAVSEEARVREEHRIIDDRLYKTMEVADQRVIVGPHEGFVDTLGLTPASATRLHNILYRRGVYNYTQAAKHPQEVLGAIQELYQLDAQKLMEAFYRFEQETTEGG